MGLMRCCSSSWHSLTTSSLPTRSVFFFLIAFICLFGFLIVRPHHLTTSPPHHLTSPPHLTSQMYDDLNERASEMAAQNAQNMAEAQADVQRAVDEGAQETEVGAEDVDKTEVCFIFFQLFSNLFFFFFLTIFLVLFSFCFCFISFVSVSALHFRPWLCAAGGVERGGGDGR